MPDIENIESIFVQMIQNRCLKGKGKGERRWLVGLGLVQMVTDFFISELPAGI